METRISFNKRTLLPAHVISGEKNKVNEQTMDEWKQEFRLIREHYSDKDVFNIDETGVFYNLEVLKRRIAGQNRKVLLTMDNCAAHKVEDLDLRKSVPLDQGIIAFTKKRYRGQLIRAAILALESNAEKPKWNVLHTMGALAESWNGVSPQVIKNCFRKAWSAKARKFGFAGWVGRRMAALSTSTSNIIDKELFTSTLTFEDYINIDKELFTSGNLEVAVIEEPTSSSDDEDEEEVTPPSRAELLTALHTIQRFADSENIEIVRTIDENFTSSLNRIVRECVKKLNK
ncbi:DDE superfamily endonuclease [Popillia japonica]|uniref:DDE superfamily endonuclease n=1 Tax=Popillia japonica TaxID=7064 RepID=A0AAW1MFU6_POPJA